MSGAMAKPDEVRAIWWPDRKCGKPWVVEFRNGRGFYPISSHETPTAAVEAGKQAATDRGCPFVDELDREIRRA